LLQYFSNLSAGPEGFLSRGHRAGAYSVTCHSANPIPSGQILALGAKEKEIASQFYGAHYYLMEFSGDTSQID
jgi:hypothetical protein